MSHTLFDPIDAERKQTLNAVAIELRERLPWLWTPGFSIGRIEGYEPGIFGTRAGTFDNINSYNALHEIAHAIELVKSEPTAWKRRLGVTSFGMRIKSYQTIAGKRYYEPETLQATQRECRVGAIQLHLLQAGGYKDDDFKTHFVETLKYMADSYLGGASILNAHDPAKYTSENKTWVNLRTTLIDQEYKKHTPESIQTTWLEVSHHLAKKKFTADYASPIVCSDTVLSL